MSKSDYAHPYPGQAFIGMTAQYGDRVTDIVIPKSSQIVTGRVGQVVAVNPFPENELSWVYANGKKQAVEAWRLNPIYVQYMNEYVVCKHATLLWGELYRVRLENIESIVPEGAKPLPDDLGRCKRCRSSSGNGNILLGPDGYCPNCGQNVYNKHKSMECFKPSEGLIDALVRKPMEVDHFMRTKGKAVSSRVYSFGGGGGKVQDNRMAVSMDSELSALMRARRDKR